MANSEDALNFFYQYGSRIWERMRFARVRNQRISETTVTENLIFDFWYQAKTDRLPIEVYEAKAEKQNGNDLEVFIETRKGYLLIALQAKTLSKKGKYPNISHKADGSYQIDLLIGYAKRKGGQACYLFYNYFDDDEYHDRLEESGKYRYRQFGLTACNAELVKLKFFKATEAGKTKMKIPAFEDLHPLHAFPLSEMLRILTDAPAMEIFEELAEMVNLPIVYYSREDIDEAYGWNEIEPRGKISGIPAKEIFATPKFDLQQGFKPKYRIVLSRKRAAGGLYILS
jgi:hypothetical protein